MRKGPSNRAMDRKTFFVKMRLTQGNSAIDGVTITQERRTPMDQFPMLGKQGRCATKVIPNFGKRLFVIGIE